MRTDMYNYYGANTRTTITNEAKPNPKRTVHTLMGDLRRWNLLCGNFPVTDTDYKLLKEYYAEKEGMADDGK